MAFYMKFSIYTIIRTPPPVLYFLSLDRLARNFLCAKKPAPEAQASFIHISTGQNFHLYRVRRPNSATRFCHRAGRAD